MTAEATSIAGPRPFQAARLVAERLLEILGEERDRLTLWLPVAFGAGIGLYFALMAEPAFWAGPVLAAAAIVGAIMGRQNLAGVILGIGLAATGLGLTVAQWRATNVAAPVIERRLGPVEVTGRVASVDIRAEGRRVTLDRLTVPGLPTAKTPEQVRVSLKQIPEGLRPGDRISVRAVLLPPPAPAAPGAYDFQRQAWFDRLGGVGFATTAMKRTSESASGDGWLLSLNGVRQAVVERTLAALPGAAGAIAAALLTGEQGAVPADVMDWMRDSGLAHILSISGLHIGLVAGIVFFAVRLGLALIPSIALCYPIKKWAAVAAFLAITLYTLFASPSVPTQRAWLMTSIVLFAVLIDRTAISMRLVAWAAFAVLLFRPESLLGPSFQMSFAAVVALVAAWEVTRAPLAAWRSRAGAIRRAAIGLGAVCLTTLVAGFASAPFALFHFNRFTAYGLAANFFAVPLTSLWVMPWAVIAFALFPFGLERFALVPMGWGVEAMIAIAREVASWDGAVALFPAMPVWGLAVLTVGGLWLCLWRTRWRFAGVPLILVGLTSIPLARVPDVLISGDARLIAVRGADGLLQISAPRAARLTRETWLRRGGQDEALAWPSEGVSADGRLTCDALGCVYKIDGQTVSVVRDPAALIEDCRVASVVIATVPVRHLCPSASLVIDRFALWRDGGHAVWLENGSARMESVRAARGDRPWVVPLPQRNNVVTR